MFIEETLRANMVNEWYMVYIYICTCNYTPTGVEGRAVNTNRMPGVWKNISSSSEKKSQTWQGDGLDHYHCSNTDISRCHSNMPGRAPLFGPPFAKGL